MVRGLTAHSFRINHEYMLPPSLRPTPVQQTIPHEHAIDGILFPSVRDRMILLRGRYDLLEAFHGYVTEVSTSASTSVIRANSSSLCTVMMRSITGTGRHPRSG